MDAEFKKLLSGEPWAQDGDRADLNDASIQPTINRDEGFGDEFSTTTAPSRQRINQIFRELSGGAKEVVYGVSPYDASVRYPAGAMTQSEGDIYYALSEHSPSTPVAPTDVGQTTWQLVGGRNLAQRTRPDPIASTDNIYIDASRADKIRLWWDWPDNGGYSITQAQVQYSKNAGFFGAPQIDDYDQGDEITISSKDSDLFYVRIRVRNQVNWSDWSPGKRVSSTPLSTGIVQSVFIRPSGTAGQVLFNYTEPDTNGLDVDDYYIQWKSSNQNYSLTSRRRVSTQDYQDINNPLDIVGFNANTAYTFRVIARSNRNTYSDSSVEYTVTPSGTDQEPSLAIIETDPISATSMRAWITERLFLNGSPRLTGIQWRWRKVTTPASTWTEGPLDGDESIVIDTERGESYEFEVRTQNQTGWSQFSSSKSQTPFTPSQPQPPTISVGASSELVEGFIKGEVLFSLGDISRPEVVKDRIIQTAVRWREKTDLDLPWTSNESATVSAINDHRFNIPQIFPNTGSLPTGIPLEIQSRWRNSGRWSDWSASSNLGALESPTGRILLSETDVNVTEGDTFTVDVKLSRIPVANVTVAITSSSTLLTPSSTSLTFTNTNWSTNQTVTFTAGTDDDVIENDVTVTFAATGGLIATSTLDAVVKEQVRLYMYPTDELTINTTISNNRSSIYFSLNTEPESPVVVTLSENSQNLNLDGQTFTFNSNNWNHSRAVSVLSTNDLVNETANLTINTTGGLVSQTTLPITLTTSGTNVTYSFSSSSTLLIPRGETAAAGGVLSLTNPNGTLVTTLDSDNPLITPSPESLTFTSSNYSSAYMNFSLTSNPNLPVLTRTNIIATPSSDGFYGQDSRSLAIVEPFNLGNSSSYNHFLIPGPDQIISFAEGDFVDVPIYIPFRQSNSITFTATSDIPNLTITQYGTNPGDTGADNEITVTNRNQGTGRNQGFRIRAPSDENMLNSTGTLTITPSGAFTTPVTVPIRLYEPGNSLTPASTTVNLASGTSTVSLNITINNPIGRGIRFTSLNQASGNPRIVPRTVDREYVTSPITLQVSGNNSASGTYQLEISAYSDSLSYNWNRSGNDSRFLFALTPITVVVA